MGLFAEWQPRYAEHGIVTFPVRIEGQDKKPVGKGAGFMKLGQPGSRQLALKFPDWDTFGLYLDRHDIDILDVDTSDERVLADGLSRHGDTPLVIRTHSGKFHALYRHRKDSERRRLIRPANGLPNTDYLLGKGLWVCPPSISSKGQYQIIQGTLDDLERLPPMRGLEDLDTATKIARAQPAPSLTPASRKPWGEMREGDGRHNALRDRVQREAHSVDSFEDLLDRAQTLNARFLEPMADNEVVGIVEWVWEIQERGENMVGRGGQTVIDNDRMLEIMALGPDTWTLYCFLRKHHWGRDREFHVANDMRKTMPDGEWSLARFRKARKALLSAGILEEVRTPSSFTGAALYRWK